MIYFELTILWIWLNIIIPIAFGIEWEKYITKDIKNNQLI